MLASRSASSHCCSFEAARERTGRGVLGGHAEPQVGRVPAGIALAASVCVVVLVALALALSRTPTIDLASDLGLRLVLVVGGAVPAAIVAVYLVASLLAASALAAPAAASVSVAVIGHQWWWEFRYGDVATANELHIPVGERIELRLISADVIHSFWVPDLQGKTDALPSQTNRMWLLTEKAGRYDGVCAEFCGVQHAWMRLVVVAVVHVPENRAGAVRPVDALDVQPQAGFLHDARQPVRHLAHVAEQTGPHGDMIPGHQSMGLIGPQDADLVRQ